MYLHLVPKFELMHKILSNFSFGALESCLIPHSGFIPLNLFDIFYYSSSLILGKHTHAWKHHYEVHAPQAKGNKSCEYCGKLFTVTGKLNSHIKEVHTKVRKGLPEIFICIQ